MAATRTSKKAALDIGPDVVCLVPEKPEELTTTGGLDVAANRKSLAPFIKELNRADIRPSIFVDPNVRQIEACAALGFRRSRSTPASMPT